MTQQSPNLQPAARPALRIEMIDIARGAALIAMAIYHFSWDLEFFGYAEAGLTAQTGWRLFARSIASSFLFLVGVSLVLAHGNGIRWKGFWRRLLMVGAAASAISAATYIAIPDDFIFFGILHQITLASLLGLFFLRLPAILVLTTAALIVAAPWFLRQPFFDHPLLWWVGLSTTMPRSNDYVPLFPWFGATLAGIGAAKLARQSGFDSWLAAVKPGSWSKPLQFAGRHSLAVYLIHQPLLIAGFWIFSQFIPPQPVPVEKNFVQACQQQCTGARDAAFCTLYCGCMLNRIEREGIMDQLFDNDTDPGMRARVEALAVTCTEETERTLMEERQ